MRENFFKNCNFNEMLNNVSSDKKFLKILKNSDENSIRTSEIFCDFEKILSRF